MILRRLAATSLAALLFAGIVPTAVLAAGPAANDDTVATLEDQPTTVIFSATNPDEDPIDRFDVGGGGPSHGSLSSFSEIDCAPETHECSQTATYTPDPDSNGQDSFDYTATAGDDTSDAATIQVNVTPVNDAPDFTKGPDVSVAKDSGAKSVPGWATDISKGPANESAQTLNFAVAADDPSLFAAGPSVSATGTLTFTPEADTHGSTSVDVTLHDSGGTANGGADQSQTRSFTISITDAPTAQNDSVTIDEDSGTTNIDVLANDDVSPDIGGELTVSGVGSAAKGTATVHSGGGSVDYVPDDDANGTDSFSYTAQDENGGTDVATVTVHITQVNDAPSFTKGIDIETPEAGTATTLTFDNWASAISAGPADEDGQALTFEVTDNTDSTLFSIQPSVTPGGALSFRPIVHGTGSATVTIHLKDDAGTANGGEDTSAPQSFVIDIEGENDPPIAGNDVATSRLPGPTTINVLANDSGGPGETGDLIKIVSATQGSRGRVTIAANGLSLAYDPAGCSTGTDRFTYTIKDTNGTGLAATGSVFVNVSKPSAYPAVDGPRPAFVKGSTIGSTTPVKLSWCGLVSGTTVKTYRLDQSRKGGAYTTAVASTKSTANTRKLAVSTAFQFRARITDKKSHSAFGTGPKFKVIRTQDTSTAIHYSSGWKKTSKGKPSGGKSHTATAKGKTATMTYTGTGFAIVGTIGKGRGSFTVYVDGHKVTSSAVKTKAKKTHYKRVVYARTTAFGTHTIKVVTSGKARVDLDAILTLTAG